MSVSSWPLQWPVGRPRTSYRKPAKFGTVGARGKQALTVADALKRLADELEAVGGRQPVVSTNAELRADGLPRSGARDPVDPGAAVYFMLKGQQIALACDRWDRLADNLAAIASHINATRAIERWGVGTASDAFAGFVALPAPDVVRRHWRAVMGFNADAVPPREVLALAFRRLAQERHPDAPGGSHDAMAELNAAHDEAKGNYIDDSRN